MTEPITETTVLSRKERHTIAGIERALSADPVLVAVAGLFAQPPGAELTPHWTTLTLPRLSPGNSRIWRAVAVLLGVLAVMAGAVGAVAAHLFAPPVAALLIVAAASSATLLVGVSRRIPRGSHAVL